MDQEKRELLGKIITRARTNANLTKKDLAAACGVSAPTIVRAEAGTCRVSLSLAISICLVTGLSLEDLVAELLREETT